MDIGLGETKIFTFLIVLPSTFFDRVIMSRGGSSYLELLGESNDINVVGTLLRVGHLVLELRLASH